MMFLSHWLSHFKLFYKLLYSMQPRERESSVSPSFFLILLSQSHLKTITFSSRFGISQAVNKNQQKSYFLKIFCIHIKTVVSVVPSKYRLANAFLPRRWSRLYHGYNTTRGTRCTLLDFLLVNIGLRRPTLYFHSIPLIVTTNRNLAEKTRTSIKT